MTPWNAARQASLSITHSQSLPKLMSVELVMPSNCLILCGPLLSLPSIVHSIRVFEISESTLHIKWPGMGMVTHSSILAWRIPWTEEPDRLPVHRVSKCRTQLKRLNMHACASSILSHTRNLSGFSFCYISLCSDIKK